MKKPTLSVKVIAPHTPVEGDYHEMITLGKHELRDAIGRNNGTRFRWLVYLCNHPDCDARALVKDDDLDKLVGAYMPPAPKYVAPTEEAS